MNRFAAPALAVAALAVSIAVPGPPAADAKKRNCGPVVRKTAATTTGGERPPLTLGDSVMLLAVDDLAQAGFRVIAQGCRGFGWGLRTLRQVQANGSLPGLVVLSLGANHYAPGEEPRGVKDGELHMRDVRKALEILDDGSGAERKLCLVTQRIPGGVSSSDAPVMRRAARKYPDQVQVLDWVRYSAGREGWFQPDGTHLTYEGAAAYVDLFSTLLSEATPPPPDPAA